MALLQPPSSSPPPTAASLTESSLAAAIGKWSQTNAPGTAAAAAYEDLKLDAIRLTLTCDLSQPSALVERFWHQALWLGIYHHDGTKVEELGDSIYPDLLLRKGPLARTWKAIARIIAAWGPHFWHELRQSRIPLPCTPAKSFIECLAQLAASSGAGSLPVFRDRFPDFFSADLVTRRKGRDVRNKFEASDYAICTCDIKAYIKRYLETQTVLPPDPLPSIHERRYYLPVTPCRTTTTSEDDSDDEVEEEEGDNNENGSFSFLDTTSLSGTGALCHRQLHSIEDPRGCSASPTVTPRTLALGESDGIQESPLTPTRYQQSRNEPALAWSSPGQGATTPLLEDMGTETMHLQLGSNDLPSPNSDNQDRPDLLQTASHAKVTDIERVLAGPCDGLVRAFIPCLCNLLHQKKQACNANAQLMQCQEHVESLETEIRDKHNVDPDHANEKVTELRNNKVDAEHRIGITIRHYNEWLSELRDTPADNKMRDEKTAVYNKDMAKHRENIEKYTAGEEALTAAIQNLKRARDQERSALHHANEEAQTLNQYDSKLNFALLTLRNMKTDPEKYIPNTTMDTTRGKEGPRKRSKITNS